MVFWVHKLSEEPHCSIYESCKQVQGLKWCIMHVKHKEEVWENVLFSDKHFFICTGPASSCITSMIYGRNKRCFHYASMAAEVWLCGLYYFSRKGTNVFIERSYDTRKYSNMLQRNLLPSANSVHPNGRIFLQNNAPIYSASFTSGFLRENGFEILRWATRFPTMNIIGNAWGILARSVYASCRQFRNREELKAKIMKPWSKMDTQVYENFSDYIPRRCKAGISAYGAKTQYWALLGWHNEW